jgi:hypothetical protein
MTSLGTCERDRQRVDAAAAVEREGYCAPGVGQLQGIVRAIGHEVVAGTGENHIGAEAAEDDVVARLRKEDVVAFAGKDRVGLPRPHDVESFDLEEVHRV